MNSLTLPPLPPAKPCDCLDTSEKPEKDEPGHRKNILDRIRVTFTLFIGHVALVGILYTLAYLFLEEYATPPTGPWFRLTVLWLASITGGAAAKIVGLPPLLGMMMAGLLLTNARQGGGGGSAGVGIPDGWGETIRASGLAAILLKSGFEIDLSALRREGGVAVRLTCIPGMCEAVAAGLASSTIFGLPVALGLSLGFILGAVSPAAVSVGMMDLQRRGYGVAKGIPSLIVAAASFDDVLAISGFSVCIGLAVKSGSSDSTVVSLLHGVLTIAIGVGLGLLGGLVLSLTRVWNRRWKRTMVTLGLVLVFTFGCKRYGYSGSGAMAAVVMGMAGSYCWRDGLPLVLSSGPSVDHVRAVEGDISVVWSAIFEPLLFGVIGSALDFSVIPPGTVSRSVTIVLLGLLVRLPAAFYATGGRGLNACERGFVALAWIPKATVQAALASLPLALVRENMSVGSDNYDRYVTWGNQILSTAVLSILMTAPLGLVFIQRLGPRMLTCDIDRKGERGGAGSDKGAESCDDIEACLAQLDGLMQRIGLQSESVACSCTIAEARKVLWTCKAMVEKGTIKNKVDSTAS